MSFQAYIDNIKEKTGKSPADFRALAEKKGLDRPNVKAGEVIAWLKSDFGLGHGHAMAIYGVIRAAHVPRLSAGERIEKHFSGRRADQKSTYVLLAAKLRRFGSDVAMKPADTYISVLRNGKKFAILKISAERIDVGIKLKSLEPSRRLAPSGTWNSMVTHRVRLESATNVDAELLSWLRKAYNAAGG